jgi:hypothetical protein
VVYILEGRRIGATGGAQRGCGVKGVEHGVEHRAGPMFSLTLLIRTLCTFTIHPRSLSPLGFYTMLQSLGYSEDRMIASSIFQPDRLLNATNFASNNHPPFDHHQRPHGRIQRDDPFPLPFWRGIKPLWPLIPLLQATDERYGAGFWQAVS